MEKELKLKNNLEFRKIYDSGKSFANRYLVIFFKKNNQPYTRVGFTTTKKLGNSVIRNKVKRRMKEAFRLNNHKIKDGYDLIFLSRVSAKDVSYKDIESAILHLAKLSGILKKGE